MENKVTKAKSKITRRNYSRISGSLELPNLVEIQTNSYKWFKEVGIKEVFEDIYPITNFNETLSLEFVDCTFDEAKYSVEESKDRDANYAAPIRASLRLVNSSTGEIKEQEVFMGDFPLMTDSGTFIINGAERVIVSQLSAGNCDRPSCRRWRHKNGTELILLEPPVHLCEHFHWEWRCTHCSSIVRLDCKSNRRGLEEVLSRFLEQQRHFNFTGCTASK